MKSESPESDTPRGRRSFLKHLGVLAFFVGIPTWARSFGFGNSPKVLAKSTSEITKNRVMNMPEKVIKSEEEWRQLLTPEQFRIMRKKGTERAFTDKYHDFKGKGIYRCAGCDLDLFSSETKFDSGTGWPSFWAPISDHHIKTAEDNSFFMKRTEALCNRCDAHLGHVFNDGPPPTGLRYCINSVALEFVSTEGKAGGE